MNKIFRRFCLVLAVIILLPACDNKQSRPPVDFSGGGNSKNSDVVSIPFRKEDSSIWIKVELNGCSFDALFDTGNSGSILISTLEFAQLVKQGKISNSDIVDKVLRFGADGSAFTCLQVRLKSLKLSDELELRNVIAEVVENPGAEVLLGYDAVNRIASKFEIDNRNKVINFTKR